MNVVVGLMPEVKGESATEETPEKAGAWVVAAASGVAVVLDGLRTLSCVGVSTSTELRVVVALTCQ